MRMGVVYLAIPFLAWAAPEAVAGRADLDRYCAGCHNSKLKSGGFALDSATFDHPGQTAEAWEKVVRKLRGRNMPPAGLPRPDERTYQSLLSTLETSLDNAAAAKPQTGRTGTFRRLNRTEYQNAIRDLLKVEMDVSSLLPADESSHGFDNITVGDLSPTLLERYLSAARKISRLAVGSPIRSPGGDTLNLPPDLTQEEHFEGLPIGTRGGTAMRYQFPRNAKYEIQLRLARDRNEYIEGLREPHEVDLLLDGERLERFTVAPPARGADHQLVDKHLNLRVPVKAGPHTVSVAFPKKPSSLLETERQPYQAHFNMDRHPRIQPALYSISVTGPYEEQGSGDTPSRRQIFLCKPANSAAEAPCAERILSAMMRRAYRRPVTSADLQAPLRFYKEARAESGFEAGIEMALSAVLISPEFLFRVEQDPPGVAANTPYRISDLELASRLSFFLWSSIPDEPLLDAAIQRKLRNPAVLHAQVRRMLADPRSDALVTNFAEQWLHLRNLSSTTPDMRLFPDFDDNLRQAFRKETQLFFGSILREDRSVVDLLSANYTFVNERLAKHYGIPNVYGSRFRRVSFPEQATQAATHGAGQASSAGQEMLPSAGFQPASEDLKRGGLLRQGSILTVTSYATRTSPVIRGKWILDNILGAPPLPPPPFVPSLKEKTGSGKTLSMRDRIAEHRANPACSGCHNIMDPLGFSLENYDAVGRWRTTEDHTSIDASGALPDGSRFDGVSGLQKALLSRPEIFVTTFTEKLLTYALGRGVEYYDAPAVRKVVRDSNGKGFRFSSIITGIAGSTSFQMRSSQ